MKGMFRTSSLAVLLLAFASLTCAALQQPSGATAPTASSAPAAASSEQSSTAAQPTDTNAKEPHGTNEELNDEEATFKYSPAVRFIARHTGLSVTSAFWACYSLNFAVIAVLIWLAMKSNLPAMLRGRTQEIQKGMEEARHASEDAGRRLHEIEARLSRLGLDIDEMQRRAETESRAEEERIRSSLEVEKQKILQAAQQEVEQATNVARRELQKYAVTLAVDLAEKGIRVDADEDKTLVEEFADQLAAEARRNGSS
jgi:F-type H+-transporting ATPase subunit b